MAVKKMMELQPINVRKVGYSRVSGKDQNLARQREVLEKICDVIYEDKQTGRNMERPGFQRMLDQLRSGDTVYITSVDRLGRNTKELINTALDLNDKGININAISQGIDTSTPMGQVFFMLLSVFAQLELEFTHQRQQEGIAVAKREGRFMGRPKKELVEFSQYLKEIESGQLTVDRACKLLGVSRSTFYRRKTVMENQTISDDTEIDF